MTGDLGTPSSANDSLSWGYEALSVGFKDRGDFVTHIALTMNSQETPLPSWIDDYRPPPGTKVLDFLEWMKSCAIRYRSSPNGKPPEHLSEGNVEILGKNDLISLLYDADHLASLAYRERMKMTSIIERHGKAGSHDILTEKSK